MKINNEATYTLLNNTAKLLNEHDTIKEQNKVLRKTITAFCIEANKHKKIPEVKTLRDLIDSILKDIRL